MYIYIYTNTHFSIHCQIHILLHVSHYMTMLLLYDDVYIYISKYVIIQRLHLGLCRVCTLHCDARNLQDSGDRLSGYSLCHTYQEPSGEASRSLLQLNPQKN